MGHKDSDQISLHEIAKQYAIERHKYVNQSYDMHPYSYHLNMVYIEAKRFIHLIDFREHDEVLAGAWVHDIIEDARENYNNVLRTTSETVAEYAYALTNEKGKNRDERANKKYYDGLKAYKHASFIKICDRIANTKFGKDSGSSMFRKYQREFEEFKKHLYIDGKYEEAWTYLEKITFEENEY